MQVLIKVPSQTESFQFQVLVEMLAAARLKVLKVQSSVHFGPDKPVAGNIADMT